MALLGWEIEFEQRSDRVKSVDLHPTHPWILTSLYSGTLSIWDYQSKSMVKSFQASDLPVRTAKFVARKQWVVAGGDDMCIHVYDTTAGDRVIQTLEAHGDYIRSVAVHPTLPYVLSASDDMLIKLWDWDNGWACARVFQGHCHYVMQVAFNPAMDTSSNTFFASACLDRTAKVWSLASPEAEFTLEGHQWGLNCVDYFAGAADNRPCQLITGSDEFTAKVWDCQTMSCIQTLGGHMHNISAVCFHPELPLIFTGSEDGTIRVWDSTTYSLKDTLNYGLGRVWALGYIKGSTRVASGYDEGTVVIKTGGQVPAGHEAPDDQLQTSVCSCVSCNNSALPI